MGGASELNLGGDCFLYTRTLPIKMADTANEVPRLSYRDLWLELSGLPSTKVYSFCLALGVPKDSIDRFQVNNPNDISRVKADSLDWWTKNVEPSWEDVAKALENKEVDERNLAKTIRCKYGLTESGTFM